MRALIFSLVALLPAGCSANGGSPPASNGAHPPSGRPPKTGTLKTPPPAWAETSRGSRWLGYSSFCWRTMCVDYVPPRCGERHTPTLRLRRGETVRFHLGFAPTEVGLTFLGTKSRYEQRRLERSRIPTLRIGRAGTFSLFARAKGGDASYVACVRFG